MSDLNDRFLRKLYDMVKGELTPIDRYEVGKELNLVNVKEDTDAIVDELRDSGMISKNVGTKIMLTLEAQNEINEMK